MVELTDNNKLQTAKDWILKLANGINPLDDSQIKDDDIVNNVHISRCLFFAAEIIGSSIQKNAKKEKDNKLEFNISTEDLNKVYISEKTGISNFVKEINKLIPDNMKPISYTKILAWLVSNGYMEEVIKEDGGKTKLPTEAGRAIGISTEMRDGSNGRFLFVVYNANAQRFILDNIYAIIETESHQ